MHQDTPQGMGQGSNMKPLLAFQMQRAKAKHRRIEWDLTFDVWWSIWMTSGRWTDRGRGHGEYVMSRKHDRGPYAVNNVLIQLATRNSSEATQPARLLPIGVTVTKARPNHYRVKVWLKGVQKTVGEFSSVESASQAYSTAIQNRG